MSLCCGHFGHFLAEKNGKKNNDSMEKWLNGINLSMFQCFKMTKNKKVGAPFHAWFCQWWKVTVSIFLRFTVLHHNLPFQLGLGRWNHCTGISLTIIQYITYDICQVQSNCPIQSNPISPWSNLQSDGIYHLIYGLI